MRCSRVGCWCGVALAVYSVALYCSGGGAFAVYSVALYCSGGGALAVDTVLGQREWLGQGLHNCKGGAGQYTVHCTLYSALYNG